MTDEQILKRLAEIEGWRYLDQQGLPFNPKNGNSINPLLYWLDLGPLIETYVQTIEKHADSPNIKEYWRGKYTVLTLDDAGVATHQSLPHAICLAIIEANGGMGDE